MGQITISAQASVSIDGSTKTASGTMVIPCTAYTTQTRDFADTYEEVVGVHASYSTVVVENVGDESLFIQFGTGSAYAVFEIVSGGHGVYPVSFGNGSPMAITSVKMRSETAAGSRAVIITVQHE